jgi:hypothetical protein
VRSDEAANAELVTLSFEPRGEHELKGVPGLWHTFAAQTNI